MAHSKLPSETKGPRLIVRPQYLGTVFQSNELMKSQVSGSKKLPALINSSEVLKKRSNVLKNDFDTSITHMEMRPTNLRPMQEPQRKPTIVKPPDRVPHIQPPILAPTLPSRSVSPAPAPIIVHRRSRSPTNLRLMAEPQSQSNQDMQPRPLPRPYAQLVSAEPIARRSQSPTTIRVSSQSVEASRPRAVIPTVNDPNWPGALECSPLTPRRKRLIGMGMQDVDSSYLALMERNANNIVDPNDEWD